MSKFWVLFPWRMYGEYKDGTTIIVTGNDEDDCMWKLCSLIDKHGELTFYTGVDDEDYVNGQYVGRDNLIYD